MATKKKLLQAAAGSAGGAGGLDITDVFSTYVYTGTGATRSINNGIDLAGEGGLVWIKTRSHTAGHSLQDTERGAGNMLSSNGTWASSSRTDSLTSFNSNGFSLGADTAGYVNYSSAYTYASWTFRKAPKFFDVIQYTGNNTARTISHNLGCDVGMIMIKCTETTDDWVVYHRKLDATSPEDYRITLNGNFPRESGLQRWNSTAPTSTEFSLGTEDQVNDTGKTFIAYLFAHNDGDGEFGPDADQDIIKCGGITNAAASVVTVDLGFEAQWVLMKRIDSSGSWFMADVMRGMPVLTDPTARLFADSSAAESDDPLIGPHATGFQFNNQWGSSSDWIYMAIRRGPLAPPEDATEVFDIYQNESTATVPAFKHPFPVDFAFYKAASNTEDWWYSARLLQGQNYRLNVQAYSGGSSAYAFDYMDGWLTSSTTQTDYYSWAWKRAPNFFDAVVYSGTNSVQNVPHNLGVAPKLMIIRMLKQNSPPVVYWEPAGNTENYFLTATANTDNSQFWNSTTPTDSVFTVKGPLGDVNYSGYNYHAMLFGELDGISKIGSYVGNGSTQNIDCGFTSGARLVLIKGSTSGDWILFDAERGIVSGDDPYLRLNSGSAQITNKDYIDAYSSGFTVNTDVSTIVNANGTTYYFYAIA